jgi:hypothetical protein
VTDTKTPGPTGPGVQVFVSAPGQEADGDASMLSAGLSPGLSSAGVSPPSIGDAPGELGLEQALIRPASASTTIVNRRFIIVTS